MQVYRSKYAIVKMQNGGLPEVDPPSIVAIHDLITHSRRRLPSSLLLLPREQVVPLLGICS